MPPKHAKPSCLGYNEHDNNAATRDSPGQALDAGARANGNDEDEEMTVAAMTILTMAAAHQNEGLADREADEETKDEDEQKMDSSEAEDNYEQDTESGETEDEDMAEQQARAFKAAQIAARQNHRAEYQRQYRGQRRLQRAIARENENKEVQKLCAALAVKENAPTNLTESEESALRGKYRYQRGYCERKVDHGMWMTWLRCPVCGTRRPDEPLLVWHQKRTHVGPEGSIKRDQVRAEVEAWLEEVERAQRSRDDEEAEVNADEKTEAEKDEEEAEIEEFFREADVKKDEEAEVGKGKKAESEKKQ